MSRPYKCYFEITEQAQAWQECAHVIADQAGSIRSFFDTMQPGEIIFTGCTSPYYIGKSAATYWQSALGIPARAVTSSELIQFPSSFYSSALGQPVLVAISRSGKTSETLWALDAFENTRSVTLSQDQFVEMLILKSSIYRKLGLYDTAIDLLKERSDFVTEKQLNARISLELADCYIASNNLEMGRSYLSEVLQISEPGEMSQKAAIKLSRICLELGYSSQAISLCLQLLDSNISDGLKSEVKTILAQAYNQEKKYEKAALALSAQ